MGYSSMLSSTSTSSSASSNEIPSRNDKEGTTRSRRTGTGDRTWPHRPCPASYCTLYFERGVETSPDSLRADVFSSKANDPTSVLQQKILAVSVRCGRYACVSWSGAGEFDFHFIYVLYCCVSVSCDDWNQGCGKKSVFSKNQK